MTAAKDNVNTRLVALVTLVSVLLLAVIIMGTDAAYSWSNSLAERGNEPGDSSQVRALRSNWKAKAEASPAWVIDEANPNLKKYATIPLTRARELVLEDRKK